MGMTFCNVLFGFYTVGGFPVEDVIGHSKVVTRNKNSAVRSGISPELVLASRVGYVYRVYYGLMLLYCYRQYWLTCYVNIISGIGIALQTVGIVVTTQKDKHDFSTV